MTEKPLFVFTYLHNYVNISHFITCSQKKVTLVTLRAKLKKKQPTSINKIILLKLSILFKVEYALILFSVLPRNLWAYYWHV